MVTVILYIRSTSSLRSVMYNINTFMEEKITIIIASLYNIRYSRLIFMYHVNIVLDYQNMCFVIKKKKRTRKNEIKSLWGEA